MITTIQPLTPAATICTLLRYNVVTLECSDVRYGGTAAAASVMALRYRYNITGNQLKVNMLPLNPAPIISVFCSQFGQL